MRLVHFGDVLKRVGRQCYTRDLKAVEKARPDARGTEGSQNLSGGSDALLLEDENLLHADDVLFHAGDLGDAGDLAGAIALAGNLDDDIERGGDLLADGAL